MRRMLAVCGVLASALVAANGSPAPASLYSAAAGPYYSVVDLGAPGLGPIAIGSGGVIAGYSYTDACSHFCAVKWSPSGHRTSLAPLPGYVGGVGYGVNASGQVAGASTREGARRATLWTASGRVDLGTIGGGDSAAGAVNDDGHVAGWANDHAFLWKDGLMADLGQFAGLPTAASDVNNSEVVIGTAAVSGLSGLGPGWIRLGGVLTGLGGLAGPQSTPYAINDRNEVVGYSKTAASGHAFSWQKGVMTDLGSLVGPTQSSSAAGINNAGQIVGGSINSHLELPAWLGSGVLWQNHKLIDLNDLIAPSNWWVVQANDINDSGRIVGVGYRTDQQFPDAHAVLLVPRVHLIALELYPATVPGTVSAVGKVRLDMPAPPGGVSIPLASTFANPAPAASVPQAVTVDAGSSSANFLIPTTAVKTTKTGKITAIYNSIPKDATLIVHPIGIARMLLAPNPAAPRATVTGRVILQTRASSDIGVSLSASPPNAVRLSTSSLLIHGGVQIGTFTLTVRAGTVLSRPVVITAQANGIATTVMLHISGSG